MWLALAFLSAMLLGLYDTAKKVALESNAVLPVLFLNCVFSTIIFSPFILDSIVGKAWFSNEYIPSEVGVLRAHAEVILKSFIVLSSWIAGYFGLKHLPITIVGPINATRPMLVLVGAMFVFGERLNLWQWAGVILAMFSIFLLSISSKKEKVDFKRNKWIWCVALASIMGAVSALYDKYLMGHMNPKFVQSWFNFYQVFIMGALCLILWRPVKAENPFRWSWAIPLISIFLSAADYAYFSALTDQDSMISVASLVRRSSVLVSFACGVVIFKERNLKAKFLDLFLLIVSMLMIWMGSR